MLSRAKEKGHGYKEKDHGYVDMLPLPMRFFRNNFTLFHATGNEQREVVCQGRERGGDSKNHFWNSCQTGICCYLVTLPLVLLGIFVGKTMLWRLETNQDRPRIPLASHSVLQTLSLWDGQWHLMNADVGYSYSPRTMSSVAFFPGYPILVGIVQRTTGLSFQLSGLIVSQFFLIASFVLLHHYICLTRKGLSQASQIAFYAVFALAVFPTSFWLRMTYSEPLFLFLCLLSVYGMERKWPFWIIALIAGAATGTRLVGAALFFVLAWHVRKNSQSARQTLIRCAWLLPLSLWGILGYMTYLWLAFDAPLAFSQTQVHWYHRMPGPLWHRLQCAITFEPVRAIFSFSSSAYWQRYDPRLPLLFSSHAMNAVIFVVAVVTGVFAMFKRWMTPKEIILAFFLLGIPYLSVGYTQYMMSHGRFALMVFPFFIAVGYILSRLPEYAALPILTILAVYLGYMSCILASGGYYIL